MVLSSGLCAPPAPGTSARVRLTAHLIVCACLGAGSVRSGAGFPLHRPALEPQKMALHIQEDTTAPLCGECYCGEVGFSLSRDATVIKGLYCHCESCRRAHSAPLYQAIYVVDDGSFKVTKGQAHVKEFQKPNTDVMR